VGASARRGGHLKVVTFYADAKLPPRPAFKSAGFDWWRAVADLERSVAASLGASTLLFTDAHTPTTRECVRVGDAKAEGVIMWLLDAQAAAIRHMVEPFLMVSPDTLIAGPLDVLFGDWDVCLLTRERPKHIVNSVISVRPSAALASLWEGAARVARALPPDAKAWGADLDVLVSVFGIQPREDAVREVGGVRIRLMQMESVFQSAHPRTVPAPLPVPIWDFKGVRKKLMPQYADLLFGENEAAAA
jgi:hypothetical protein